MNRGDIGCFTVGVCEVGLENCQDAQIICECEKVGKLYMWVRKGWISYQSNGGGTFNQQEEQEPNKKESYAEDLHGGTAGGINGGAEVEEGGRAESSASAISKTAEKEENGADSSKQIL